MKFNKLYRKSWSPSAHRTETVTTMGHERSVGREFHKVGPETAKHYINYFSPFNSVICCLQISFQDSLSSTLRYCLTEYTSLIGF